ncbi:MAG: helix-turn-helix transcriptional regulator [Eudoraea sp.]|nr:helix-turn-helix transcriptional regulator [Eudoraea sp.]
MNSKSGNAESSGVLSTQDLPHLQREADPLRVVMRLETSNYLNRLEANQFSIFTQKFHKSVSKTIEQYEGRIIRRDNNTYLVLFESATNAVLCALKIQGNYKYITPKDATGNRKLKIGISTVKTAKEGDEFVAEAITSVSRMCEVVQGQLIISSAIKTAYEQENKNALINQQVIRTLRQWEERFLNRLMDKVEKMWNIPNFNVATLSREMGWSRSQFYRKLLKLSGKSPNTFIRGYRLRRALGLLHKGYGNISEIAVQSGFRNPSYFSKCFADQFGILPSKYARQHIS